MERGEIAPSSSQVILFVFEDLIATCDRRRLDQGFNKLYLYNRALDLWVFQVQVCDWMRQVQKGFNGLRAEVITWHSPGFAQVLHDRLWNMDVPVSATWSAEYRFLSHRVGIDREVLVVYDPDPNHRFGYGFKCREFSPSLEMI